MFTRVKILGGFPLVLAVLLGSSCSDREENFSINKTDAETDARQGGDAGPDGSDRACQPLTRRCLDDGIESSEVCRADGSGWDATRCNTAQGEVCSGGSCVTLGETRECERIIDDANYSGCEFWPVTLANYYVKTSEHEFAVSVTNVEDSDVLFRVEGGALETPILERIGPKTAKTVKLPWVDVIATAKDESGLYRDAAYRISSSGPVSVAQFNPITSLASADAAMLLPTQSLGKDYTVLTTINQNDSFHEHPGSFAVVGVQDGTQVTLAPTVEILGGPGVSRIAGQSRKTLTLDAGDVLQLIAKGIDDDLTGTLIETDKPVAAFSAHLCVNLPGTACDHLEEQIFPTQAWGRRYAATTFGDSPDVPFMTRILAARDNTTVTFDPPSTSDDLVLQAGEFVQLIASGQFVIEANEPILVAEFIMGRGEGGEDPSMLYAVPIEQYRTRAVFSIATEFDDNFANLVGPSASPPRVNGAAISATPVALGTSGLSVWRVPLTDEVNVIDSVDSAAKFGVAVYGFRSAGSYTYGAGLDLAPINPVIR